VSEKILFANWEANKPKMAELIAEEIRRSILLGDLPPGSMLPHETALMEQFKTSRPTLREAIRILESESLITLRRGSRHGAEVTGPSPAKVSKHLGMLLQSRETTLEDVYRARTVLEPACAAVLASRGSSEIAARLRELLDNEETATDLDEVTLAGTHFHEAILKLADDTTIGMLGSTLLRIVRYHGEAFGHVDRADVSVREGHLRAMHKSHVHLFNLVVTGQPEDAETFWRRHMEAVSGELLERVGRQRVNLFVSNSERDEESAR
jgi:GntR family transcriptional regulator, transcriptional repressor for pyruvate dehydrogenase complex